MDVIEMQNTPKMNLVQATHGYSSVKNILENLDPKLSQVFFRWALRHPRYIRTFARLGRKYKKYRRLRLVAKSEGLQVPPVLILSITKLCNLACPGCYAAAVGTISKGRDTNNPQLNFDEWHKIIGEAQDLGVQMFIIAGGEPFLFPDLLEICKEFKNSFFVIVTNATAIHNEQYKKMKKLGNIAVIVSLEGNEELTDFRRGKDVYKRVISTLTDLNRAGVLSGISVTITRMNYNYWVQDGIIDNFIDSGIRIGVFLEYIPTSPNTNNLSSILTSGKYEWSCTDDRELMLTKNERETLRNKILQLRATKPIYLIHSPGDEDYFGGCVSAGRGFAHITPGGDLTPCPVTNVATHNLNKSSLREALASPLFEAIRENEHLLETDGMPCALFAHPEELDAITKSVGGYYTV
jgi:MoaA/NifB/PqqE/SkfB family radical SAM enzyme